tara:strand:- start:11 stop:475 length:465 start_codon:yes stop_codon:yes gene_type:complete
MKTRNIYEPLLTELLPKLNYTKQKTYPLNLLRTFFARRSIEHDPDIQHLPVFAVSENCFDTDKLVAGGAIMDKEDLKKGFYSTYHEKYMTMDFLWKFLVSYQHFLFYPIMAVARFNLYAQGIIFIYNCKQQDGWHAKNFQKLEAVSMAMFLTGE